MTERSIREHTKADMKITHVYPEVEEGCTGFSNVRFSIEYGIYLDADMIVLGDISDLWAYRKKGYYVCMEDGSTEVGVIDCKHECMNKHELHKLPILPIIPLCWNVEDRVNLDAKLVHFTNLKTQPWFFSHPDSNAVALYQRYAEVEC